MATTLAVDNQQAKEAKRIALLSTRLDEARRDAAVACENFIDAKRATPAKLARLAAELQHTANRVRGFVNGLSFDSQGRKR